MEDKKTTRRYKRANRRIAKAKAKSPKKGRKAEKKYGYNYKAAEKAGLKPDETGHYPSRNPETGEILKGRKHPTIGKTKKAERKLGYKIYRKNGKLYSRPKKTK